MDVKTAAKKFLSVGDMVGQADPLKYPLKAARLAAADYKPRTPYIGRGESKERVLCEVEDLINDIEACLRDLADIRAAYPEFRSDDSHS